MRQYIPKEWEQFLQDEFDKPYFKKLDDFLKEERNSQIVYPPEDKVFSSLTFVHPHDIKVVIIGQDPYPNEGEAQGLCFSVPNSMRTPRSLKNIFKELAADLESPLRQENNLEDWAKQGVLLLNTILTVRAKKSNSHKDKGWEQFTNAILRKISEQEKPLVFMLWGKEAQLKKKLLDSSQALILQVAHPSPLSAQKGFFGCKHFSQTNMFLKQNGLSEINWNKI